MNASEIFIKRPVATTLLTLGIALAGGAAFFKLPVAPLPQIDFPTISVQASLPGASPETMAATVATPLERALGRIAGVTEISSSSSLGSTRVTLQFDLDRNIDGAARDVQAALAAARSLLPSALPGNPTYRKVNPADAPVMILTLTSDSLTRGQMYDAASTILAQKLAQVQGIGQVVVGGSSLPAVRVELNPPALNKYGIGVEDVRAAIVTANANRPKGSLELGDRHWQIQANDQARGAADYIPVIVTWRDGAAVRLSDVAEVTDSVQDLRNAGLASVAPPRGPKGNPPAPAAIHPSVLLILFRQPGANIIDTVGRVKALLPELRAEIPGAITLGVAMDRTPGIRASLREVERSLLLSVALVILVVFLFLRNARAALVPTVAVPVSLIGTFGVMYLCGYSLDNLSLMALTIATGFVVDDAVVVLENVSRHIDDGMTPALAALRGAREVGFTVLSMTLSLIAVFIPLLLMGGIVGRLFHEFAVTLSAAILVSLVVSLTTTPMMCARILLPRAQESPGRFHQASERIYQGILRRYRTTLDLALARPRLVLAVLLVTVSVNAWLYTIVPKGFIPQQDTGRLSGSIQADQSISFQAMNEKLSAFVKIVSADPAVDNVTGSTGGGQRNSGQLFVALKPLGSRPPLDVITARLRKALAREPGATLTLLPVQDIRVGGQMSSAQFQYTLQADDVDELRAWEPKIRQALMQLPVLADVTTDQNVKGLQTTLIVDRDAAARLGIPMRLVDATLNDLFGQRLVSTIYNPLNQYRVVMEAAPQYWQSPETLRDVHVKPPGGVPVPLAAFSRYEPDATPLAVNHLGQFAAATISFNLAPGKSLSDATRAVAEATRKLGVPATVRGSFQGTAKAFQASLDNQGMLILTALLAVYIVLGVLYESYVHPVTILSTLPSAGVGALLALLLCRMEFSLIALIGVILLIGIVKKNAIMMIDFALDAERTRGLGPREAIREACLLRFRPIMMTTLAALFGALPLALGSGDGAELRRPLGVSIVGGLIVSQLLTLYTVPVVYLYLDRLRLWSLAKLKRKQHPGPSAATPVPGPV